MRSAAQLSARRPHAGVPRTHGCARTQGRLLPACRAAAAARGRAPSAAGDSSRASGVPQLPDAPGPVLVWFKHDLRVADNPGLLAAAATGAPLLPVFCLSPRLYSQLSLTPGGPAALLAGVTQLRTALRVAGSDLVVRVGCPEHHLPGLAAAAGASRIVLEREEESRWLEASHRVAQALEAAGGSGSSGAAVRMVTWQAPLWPRAGYDTNFKAWLKRRGKQPLPPLPAPGSLNGPLPAGIEPGGIPTLPELEGLLAASLAAGQTGADTPHTAATEAAQSSAAAAAEGDVWGGRGPARDALLRAVLAEPAAQSHAAAASQLASLLLHGSSSTSTISSSEAVLTPQQLLTGYLQSSDGGRATDARLAFLAEAIGALETPAAVGASFPALLGPLLHLGLLSARQVHDVTVAVEAARWGGRMPLLGPSTTAAKAALSAVELTDFHRALASHIPQEGDSTAAGASPPPTAAAAAEPVASAASSLEEGPDGVEQWGAMDWPRGTPRRCSWRWRGALTDFTVVEPERPLPGAPALVLIHGFGAFGDQWRFNFGPLAEAGYTVYAPTLPGFGRSEKAALPYSQNAWRDFIRDFLVCVVGRPAVLAGNSIGGFISASTAADYPALVAGLALVNSAGPVTPGISEAQVAAMAAEVRKPPPAWVVRGTTWALMAYLQNSIGKQLAWLYPTNPGAADAWLQQEIYRAACDARSADVFASVFYLPKPRPLNYLINNLWRGPTAVVQGVLDPLNDAQGRADLLERECPGLRVWAIQAGHCPHDEAPQAVNAALLEFVEQMVLPQQQTQGQQQQAAASAPAAAAVAAK